MKVLIRKGKKLYWKSGDCHSKDGLIKKEVLEAATNKVSSHSGKDFNVYEANFLDQLATCKRGPQILIPKDLGYILHHAALTKESIIVDAGTGCGFLAATLARHAKRVFTYDRRPEHTSIAQSNMKYLGIKNVTFKNGDVYEGIEETEVDVLTLDLAEPWRVSTNCVKNGGTIIVYLPTITQVMQFCEQSSDHIEKVVELLEREWHVEGRRVRPNSQMLGHTAFLIIVRKL
jgi:tRNA (adenine57-N1/adenine58-N1)-methyltransferase catalytic subunit